MPGCSHTYLELHPKESLKKPNKKVNERRRFLEIHCWDSLKSWPHLLNTSLGEEQGLLLYPCKGHIKSEGVLVLEMINPNANGRKPSLPAQDRAW